MSFKKSDLNVTDLTLLANYLEQLPQGYEQFEMLHFTSTHNDLENIDVNKGFICGTSGCAVGHAPFVPGISKPLENESWSDYSDRIAFSVDELDCLHEDIWEFMFGSFWSNIDNTPQGAARRIKAVLVDVEKCFGFIDKEHFYIWSYYSKNHYHDYISEIYQQFLSDLGV